jgi:hypothetical protein
MEQLMVVPIPDPTAQLTHAGVCNNSLQEGVVRRRPSQRSIASIGAFGAEINATVSTLRRLFGKSLAAEEG